MTKLTARNEAEAKSEAIQLSNENPGMYITITATFGLYASLAKRLHTFAPSDSVFAWYVLNGTIRQFSSAQRIADQNATPKRS